MAAKNQTFRWLLAATAITVAACGEEAAETDITNGMAPQEALEVTRTRCNSALVQWDTVMNAGADDSGIPVALDNSRRCDRNASIVLGNIPADGWSNPHCRAAIEGYRNRAQWEIEHGPTHARVADTDTPPDGMEAEVRQYVFLVGMVRHELNMCENLGVVG